MPRRTVTSGPELMQQIRAQGRCLVDQELEKGLISMAAPVFHQAGETVAARNISGQASRTSAKALQQTMLPALREAAITISLPLHWKSPH